MERKEISKIVFRPNFFEIGRLFGLNTMEPHAWAFGSHNGTPISFHTKSFSLSDPDWKSTKNDRFLVPFAPTESFLTGYGKVPIVPPKVNIGCPYFFVSRRLSCLVYCGSVMYLNRDFQVERKEIGKILFRHNFFATGRLLGLGQPQRKQYG